MIMHPIGLSECIEQGGARRSSGAAGERPSAPHKRRGKGIAICWKAPAMPPNAGSEAWVRFNEDATVSVAVSGQELGQGTFTVAAQMAAETLGVPYEWVRISRPVDTRYSPYEWQTVASRLTWSMGNAVRGRRRRRPAADRGDGGALLGRGRRPTSTSATARSFPIAASGPSP